MDRVGSSCATSRVELRDELSRVVGRDGPSYGTGWVKMWDEFGRVVGRVGSSCGTSWVELWNKLNRVVGQNPKKRHLYAINTILARTRLQGMQSRSREISAFFSKIDLERKKGKASRV